jgi:hypothetical protein
VIVYVYTNSKGSWWIDKVFNSINKLIYFYPKMVEQLPEVKRYALLVSGETVEYNDLEKLGIKKDDIMEVFES